MVKVYKKMKNKEQNQMKRMKSFSVFAMAATLMVSFTAVACNPEDSSKGPTSLEAVKNVTYSEGVLSFDAVADAATYKVVFTHAGEEVYSQETEETSLNIESLGLAGNISVSVTAHYNDVASTATVYDFTVLSVLEDVLYEAENNLYDFGTGKGTANFRNNAAAHGGAYVGGIDDAGQGVYINHLSPVAGEFTFVAYYTTDMPTAYNDVWVNGEKQTVFEFTEKTGWGGATYTPEAAEVTITLKKGWNTISVMKNGTEADMYGSYCELDYFILKGDDTTTYNVDELTAEYGVRPDAYRLEAEMGSPRKDGTVKNPCIASDETNSYSNGFLMGGIEKNYDGVGWHFNSPVKAKYKVKIAYASGEFTGSKLARPSLIVTQTEIGLAKVADFANYPCVTFDALPYTGWNNVQVATQEVEIVLEEGKNFIHCLLLDSVDSGFFQLDYIDISFVEAL